MEPINPIIYIISGKARHGKDTIANIINEYYQKNNKKVISLHYATCVKEYAKNISGWDGSDETKPRSLLQQLSTEIIRKKIDSDFFVNRLIEDVRVYSYFFNAISIPDARMKVEVDKPRSKFKNVIVIRVNRPNFDNGLNEEQQKHITEVDLDDYDKFDYFVTNDGTIEDLKGKIVKIIEEVDQFEKAN